ncbi:MAG: Hsp70 family protein, partial [Bacteroidota bacterium]
TTRKHDTVGEIVEDWGGEIDEIATMDANLAASDDLEGGTVLPVWLESKVTEIGTLELWCVARDTEQRWKLEFELRG